MYNEFYGFKEIPFSIAPNPQFLFMSERHKEALAHLTYGLGETGGFVLLTGEVGTGKTTVSRCLLERLPDNTQSAFILNPTLSSQELLATVCDELGIRYRKSDATLKTLTDKIQAKLLSNHEQGLNTLLIIDEAQHLQPEVLEQLRLLTNLETNTKKLLQVILIGQPELQELLQRRDLRQLAQRITARYHLLPLNKSEVAQYIQHRIHVAGGNGHPFSNAAVQAIHRISGGVPRLINLLCDRALLGAFGKGQLQVDKRTVLAASTETLGQATVEASRRFANIAASFVCVLLLLLVSSVSYHFGFKQQFAAMTSQAQLEAKKAPTTNVLTQTSQVINNSQHLPLALTKLFSFWRISEPVIEENPCELAQQYQLSCHWFNGNINGLKTLNYPAVMKFYDEQGIPFYGVLSVIDEQSVTIDFAQSSLNVDAHWLNQYWHGGALVLWQPPKNQAGEFVELVNDQSETSSLQWLESMLSQQQGRPVRMVESFDNTMQNQLQQFQQLHALYNRNFADTETLMILNNKVAQGQPIFNGS